MLLLEYASYGRVRACDACYFGQVIVEMFLSISSTCLFCLLYVIIIYQDSISIYPHSESDESHQDTFGNLSIHVPSMTAHYESHHGTHPPAKPGQNEMKDIARLHRETWVESAGGGVSSRPGGTRHALDLEALEKGSHRRQAQAEERAHNQASIAAGRRCVDDDVLLAARQAREAARAMAEEAPRPSAQAESVRLEVAEAQRAHRQDEMTRAKEYATMRHTLSSVPSCSSAGKAGRERGGGRSIPQRSIPQEIERMTSPMFGTLRMVQEGLGVDSSAKALMSFAEDKSGELHVWMVCGVKRVLVEWRGVFRSTGCYAILYR